MSKVSETRNHVYLYQICSNCKGEQRCQIHVNNLSNILIAYLGVLQTDRNIHNKKQIEIVDIVEQRETVRKDSPGGV